MTTSMTEINRKRNWGKKNQLKRYSIKNFEFPNNMDIQVKPNMCT